ncbi:hypothetical protein [Paenibacillus phocaensis]|uniref:hypothetical protein n=1 Tax=Paenibacillus phocaensis TaxID=1776378 RepID=UPI000839B7FE|nr:hypothetical protein [Paenibacillus phocaensis]
MAKGITLQELDTAAINRLIVKDAAGRAKVAAPAAADDIALKSTVDNAVGPLPSLLTSAKTNTVTAINELFTNVSDGKNAIAAAITGKGVPASGSDTFAGLAGKIGQIVTGMKSSTGFLAYTGTLDRRTISDLVFTPKLIILKVELVRDGYIENGNGYRLMVNLIATTGAQYYPFDGSVFSPIYGSQEIRAYLYASFGANSVELTIDGAAVRPYQTVSYTIYGE